MLEKNYTIQRGLTFKRVLTLKSGGALLDLTGYSVAGQVRVRDEGTLFSPGAGESVLDELAEIAADQTVEGGSRGRITLDFTLGEYAAGGSYYYDVILTYPNNDRRQVIKGIVSMEEVNTHADV